MPFTSSVVTFRSSYAFTASCNDRWCTDANRLSNPVSRCDAAEGGTKVRPVYQCGAVRMCACHVLEQEGRTETRYCKP
jgi:hypothetical protein